MSDINRQVELLQNSKCPVRILSELLSVIHVSAENYAELDDVISILETHENEIRSLRQSLSINLRQYSLEYYSEFLKNKIQE